jgi:hypothetical protein
VPAPIDEPQGLTLSGHRRNIVAGIATMHYETDEGRYGPLLFRWLLMACRMTGGSAAGLAGGGEPLPASGLVIPLWMAQIAACVRF